ncbi:MAG: serine/threonine protein kinase [Sandaracinaceae bacterium]|nr:serine/threonine protein kinase [Sandaracinaceae bacterium]
MRSPSETESDAGRTIASDGGGASTPGSSGGSSPHREAHDLLERQEHVANVQRLRSTLTLALAVWPTFIVLDAIVDISVRPGVLLPFAVLRGLFWPVIGLTVWRLHRAPPPTPALLRGLQVLNFGGAALTVSLMCIWYGGLPSPYLNGVSAIAALQGAAFAEQWRRGGLLLGGTAAIGPVTLIVAAAFVPELADQLRDPAALAVFGQHVTFAVTVAGFATLGTHLQWSLRREVFESRSIGRYRLETRLGKGGMGEVWAAWHNGLRRNVALKLLRASDARPSAIARFEREVAAMSELTHPNTVRVFDYGVTEDGIWYYAMELLEGEDLGKVLSRSGAQPVERAVHLIWQAARALAEAHVRGTVHRDLKPENLFVTTAGIERDFLKVLDFGIAKRAERDVTVTQAGWIGGTPAYMSPEAASGRPCDARGDVYALGVVLYELLAGRAPFEGDNAARLLFAHMHTAPPPLSQWCGDRIPADVDAVVMRCLEKEPDRRFSDAGQLAEALARCDCFGRWDARLAAETPGSKPREGHRRADSLAATVDGEAQTLEHGAEGA